MKRRERVLLIDDDPVQRMLANNALADQYEVLECESGRSGIDMAKAESPDLVLLDINMPGMDGFETCRGLRQEIGDAPMPVLFLSGEVSKEDRMHAYESGGEDFIAKPFDPDELLAKVSITLKAVQERARLAATAQSSFQTAMTAMSSASEMGVVMQALRRGFAARTPAELADTVLGGCQAYGLDACVQLRTTLGDICRNMAGDSSPIERGVMANMATSERIFSLGRRSVYNYGEVTLMIKDMPKGDPERYGRLRDNLALLAEGADARLHALDTEMAIETQRQVLEQVLATSFSALESIDSRHQRQRAEAQYVLTGMLQKIEDKFYSLGLTENQEAAVSNTVREASHKVFDLYDEGLNVAEHIGQIRTRLAALPVPRSRKMLEESLPPAAAVTNAVDLF